MNITSFNPSTENLEKTYLSASYAAGVTAIDVRNNDRFSGTNCRIMIGEMGREKTEIVTCSAVNANGIGLTVGATKFPHEADDPVYVLKYDQMKFTRSTTGISGTYNALATVNLDVDNADKSTTYADATGLPSYYYKVAFFHSLSSLESSYSDPIPGSGYTRAMVGSLVQDFLDEIGDQKQEYITVREVIALLNECNDDMLTQSRKPFRWLKARTTLNITGEDDRIDLPTGFYKLDRMRYNYELGAEDRTDLIRIIDIEEMETLKYDNTALSSDEMVYIAIDEETNELVLYPTPDTTQTAKLTINYYGKFSDYTGLGDTIQTPTPRVYKLFLLGRFYRKRAIKESSFLNISDRYLNDYQTEAVKIQRANKLDVGSPTGFKPDFHSYKGLRKA